MNEQTKIFSFRIPVSLAKEIDNLIKKGLFSDRTNLYKNFTIKLIEAMKDQKKSLVFEIRNGGS